MQGLGIARKFSSVPTMDTERSSAPTFSTAWSPQSIDIFGHLIAIDVMTGNLRIAAKDIGFPYYSEAFGIQRKYDAQEQYMAHSYFHNHPNVDPRPTWFGNWRSEWEASVEDLWHTSICEIQICCEFGLGGLFSRLTPDSSRRFPFQNAANLLAAHGVPAETLRQMRWAPEKQVEVLRTTRGPFRILSGAFRAESLNDPTHAELLVFDPTRGTACRISSQLAYDTVVGGTRRVGCSVLVMEWRDGLGHFLQIQPTQGKAAFERLDVVDGSGRRLGLVFAPSVAIPDGRKRDRALQHYTVSTVVDRSRSRYKEIAYTYSAEGLLQSVAFPSTSGQRIIRYHYDDARRPALLTGIENHLGDRVSFEYADDPRDDDERLDPKLKIKRITGPEGEEFLYEYDYTARRTRVIVSSGGVAEREILFRYVRDLTGTKQRYIVEESIRVSRGYVSDRGTAVTPRPAGTQQLVSTKTAYSADGHFNVVERRDALDRSLRYEYNDFNQVTRSYDLSGRATEYSYDLPLTPDPTHPRRYDLLAVTHQNLLRSVNSGVTPVTMSERVTTVSRSFTYGRFDAETTSFAADAAQSTHRMTELNDERGQKWIFGFANQRGSFLATAPTEITTPCGNKTVMIYGDRGETLSVTDAEGNLHKFEYSPAGVLQRYIGPDQRKCEFVLDAAGDWVNEAKDGLANKTILNRDAAGALQSVVDANGVTIDYRYYRNGRLSRILRHRPAAPQGAATGFTTTNQPDVPIDFEYGPLGNVVGITNASALRYSIDYDEAGRPFRWGSSAPGSKDTVLVHDAVGQVVASVDGKRAVTRFSYNASGWIQSIQYPRWSKGRNSVAGKAINYAKYDYEGHPLSANDSELGTFEYAFDAAGKPILESQPGGFSLIYQYDADGELTRVSEVAGEFDLVLARDALGRIAKLSDSPALDGTLDWTYSYRNSTGGVLNLFQRSLANLNLTSDFGYDPLDRVMSVDHQWSGRRPVAIHSQTCKWRADSMIGEVGGDDARQFSYDDLKQLVHEDPEGLSSDYDMAGNRLYRADRSATASPPQWTYDALNRVQADGQNQVSYTFDANGSVTSVTSPAGTCRYYFDGARRLRRLEVGGGEVDYVYDMHGRLVERSERSQPTAAVERFQFKYHGRQLVRVDRNGTKELLLTWEPGGPLLRIRRTQTGTAANFPHSLFPLYVSGSPAVYVDGDRNSVAHIDYDAWGNTNGALDWIGEAGFTGYREGFIDPTSQLIRFGARWYDPRIGRWISQDPSLFVDPAAYGDISNLYAYVRNNPVSHVDRNGLATDTTALMKVSAVQLALFFGTGSGAREIVLREVKDLHDGRQTLVWEYHGGSMSYAPMRITSRVPDSLILKPGLTLRISPAGTLSNETHRTETFTGKLWDKILGGLSNLSQGLQAISPSDWNARSGDFGWQAEQDQRKWNAADRGRL